MGNRKKSNWVSASDVGMAAYCPHYLELKEKGIKPSQESLKARENGEKYHEAFNRQADDGRCYIATHLYGYDHPITCLLRGYRDQILASNATGRVFIQIYYVLSPYLVIASLKLPVITRIMRRIIDRQVIRILESRSND